MLSVAGPAGIVFRENTRLRAQRHTCGLVLQTTTWYYNNVFLWINWLNTVLRSLSGHVAYNPQRLKHLTYLRKFPLRDTADSKKKIFYKTLQQQKQLIVNIKKDYTTIPQTTVASVSRTKLLHGFWKQVIWTIFLVSSWFTADHSFSSSIKKKTICAQPFRDSKSLGFDHDNFLCFYKCLK